MRRALVPLLILALAGCGSQASGVTVGGGADAARAPDEIGRYGCGSCHTIAGIAAARGDVGPALEGFAQRRYIAGRLPNTPANLIHWIRHPQQVDRGNVMPELGVTPQEARDIAAYLYSH
jgi:cytochrome c